MTQTDTLTEGNFLNGENAVDGDIVEIVGEGEIKTMKKRDGTEKQVLNLPVTLNGKSLVYTPAFKSLKILQEIFSSSDTADWIGKKFQCKVIKMEIGGVEKDVLRPQGIEA